MSESAEDEEAYEALVSRVMAQFPRQIMRRNNGKLVVRPRSRRATQALCERLAKGGLAPDRASGLPTGRDLRTLVAGLSPVQLTELGLDPLKVPRHLRVQGGLARLGYDFDAADRVLELLPSDATRPVGGGRYLFLDSHCGPAIRALRVALPASGWVGVEADEEAHAWAAARIKGASFLPWPGTPQLGESDASFDGAVAFGFTHWHAFGDLRSWFAELQRLVRPGGFLITSTPGFIRLAHLADTRQATASDLEAAYRALEVKGTAVLSVSGRPETFFSEAAFRDATDEDGWEFGRSLPGACPGLCDAYILERRPGALGSSLQQKPAMAGVVGMNSSLSTSGRIDGVDRPFAGAQSPRREPPKRFVVLAMQRTGSNMVVSALRSHPAIHCHGELFRRSDEATRRLRSVPTFDARFHDISFRMEHPEEYLEAVLGIDYGVEFVGFKLLSRQHLGMRDRLAADPRYFKILLRRDNVLARYSSEILTTSIRRGEAKTGDRIAFAADKFMAFRRMHDQFYDETYTRLKASGQPFLEISYVDACTTAGLHSIVHAIGADSSVKLHTKTRKRNSSNVLGRFSNPEDVQAYLARNGLEHWREEAASRMPRSSHSSSSHP
jgi:SAM-dependent methyltransferase